MSADRLQELHDRFAARLGTRLSQLRECIDASRQSDDEQTRLQWVHEAMRNFHSLAGIGGTYGYPNITAAARDAELECNHVIESGAGVETVEELFARLYEVASPVFRNAGVHAGWPGGVPPPL